jgi:hypothetical protein
LDLTKTNHIHTGNSKNLSQEIESKQASIEYLKGNPFSGRKSWIYTEKFYTEHLLKNLEDEKLGAASQEKEGN